MSTSKHPGQKPIHIRAQSAAGKLMGRDAMWHIIRQLKQFTINQVRGELSASQGCNRATIKSYINSLVSGGYLSLSGMKGRELAFNLEKDIGAERPRIGSDGQPSKQGLGREQMWRAMRILGEFSSHDLATSASLPNSTVSPETTKEYCLFLERAGYLVVTAKGKPGHPPSYRFIPSKFTGPKPPMIQRIKQVFDPNLQQVVWPTNQEANNG